MNLTKKQKNELVSALMQLPKNINIREENLPTIFYFCEGVADYLDRYFRGEKPSSKYPKWKQELLELYVKRVLAFYDACFFGWEMFESPPITLPFSSPLGAVKWFLFFEAQRYGAAPKEQPWRSLRTYAPLRYLHKHNRLSGKEKKKAESALSRIQGEWEERDRENHRMLLDILQLLACSNSAQDSVKEFLRLDDEMMGVMAHYSQHQKQRYRT